MILHSISFSLGYSRYGPFFRLQVSRFSRLGGVRLLADGVKPQCLGGQFAIENGWKSLIYPLKTVIFQFANCFRLPEGISLAPFCVVPGKIFLSLASDFFLVQSQFLKVRCQFLLFRFQFGSGKDFFFAGPYTPWLFNIAMENHNF